VKIFGKPWWLVLLGVFFAWYLITDPTGAAHAVTAALNGLKGIGNSLKIFFNSL
jgi:hypothetical protein